MFLKMYTIDFFLIFDLNKAKNPETFFKKIDIYLFIYLVVCMYNFCCKSHKSKIKKDILCFIQRLLKLIIVCVFIFAQYSTIKEQDSNPNRKCVHTCLSPKKIHKI